MVPSIPNNDIRNEKGCAPMSELVMEEQTLHPVSLGTMIHDKKGFDETLSKNVDKDDNNIHEDGQLKGGNIMLGNTSALRDEDFEDKRESVVVRPIPADLQENRELVRRPSLDGNTRLIIITI